MKIALLLFALVFASPAFADDPENLIWEDLLPEGELERLDELYASQQLTTMFDHSSNAMMNGGPQQIGTFNVVDDLDGKLVRIPGFVLPFEYVESGEITEFLLVPYFGACIHVPPPPPNQLIYVTSEKPAPLGQQWEAIWAIGILRTQKKLNELGDAAYTLEFVRWERYDG